MNLKQIIPGIIAIIIMGIAITVLSGPSTPEVEDDNQETETPDSGGETVDVTEPATDEDGCIEIFQSPSS